MLPEIANINIFILLIFSGYIFGLFFHHLTLYSYTKEKTYLYFAVYLLALYGGILSVVDGMDGSWGEVYDYIPLWLETLLLQLYHVSLILFSLHINEIDRLSQPMVKRSWKIALFVAIGITFLMLGDSGVLPTSIFVLIAFVYSLYLTYFGRHYSVEASTPFLWSLFPLFVIALAHICAINGFIPFIDDLSSEVVIGTIWHVSTLAYLVSKRIGRMQSEHQKILIENNHLYLQSRNAAMGETIANIAHQWKQPLNAIASIQNSIKTSLVFEKPIDGRELYEAVDTSSRLLTHIGDTIDTFYGFLTHHNNLQKQFNVVDSIETVKKLTEYDFQNRNIQLSIDYDRQSLIMGNANELIHAVLNIVINAKELFDDKEVESPKISIRIAQTEHQCIITISDNAGGIKIKPIEAIFDRYISDKSGGSGLGLYITREIITNRFNGSLNVENTDKGCMFTVILPSSQREILPLSTRENDLIQIQKLSKQILDLEKIKGDLTRWEEIFKHAQWAIMVHLGVKDTFEHVNPMFFSLYGYTPEDMHHLKIQDLFPPEALEEMTELSSRAFETGYIVFESIHCRKDGSRFPVSIELIVVKNDEGEVLYHIANVWDLTEKKEVLKHLELITVAINSTDEAIYINDENLSIIFVNESACKMLGYTKEEFYRLGIWDIDANYSYNELVEFRKGLFVNTSVIFETKHRTKCGECIDVEIVANLFVFDDQKIGLSMVKNITERKQIQEKLLKSEEQYRTLVEHSNDNIIRYDRLGRIVYLNPALQTTLGISMEYVLGKTPTELFHEEYKEFETILHRVIATGIGTNYHLTFTGADQKVQFHHIQFIAERDSSGNIVGALAIGRNLTELI
jgi:two-component system, sensor histidine kinase LadS